MIVSNISNRLRQFGSALAQINPAKVFHYRRPANVDGAILWAEDSGDQGGFAINNAAAEIQLHGTVDFFTAKEYDETVDRITGFLNSFIGIGWAYVSVQYEDETGLIHHEWEFWLS